MNLFHASSITLAAETPSSAPDASHSAPQYSIALWMEDALFAVSLGGVVLIAIAIGMCVFRVMRGPTLADRGLAGDTIAVLLAGLVIILTIVLETLVLFDAVLIVAILGFGSTVAFAQYIGRRREA